MNGILLVLLLLILIFCICYLCFQRKEGFDLEPSRVAQIVEPNLDMNQPTSGNEDSICQQ